MKTTIGFALVLVAGTAGSFPALCANADHSYRGTLGERRIELYLAEREQPCNGEPMYHGMYRYDGNPGWLQLQVTANAKRQFVMVEDGFSGVLMLKEAGQGLSGEWTSPDQARRWPVTLRRRPLDAKGVEALEDAHEKLNHRNNDC